MYKPISLFISLRYLWNPHLPKFKKFIMILSIMGISISTASLIIIISVINGSEENFKKNILSFVPHLIITNKNKYIHKSEFPKEILKLNNVEKISDFVNKEVIVQNKDNITMGEIIAIDTANYDNISNYHIKNFLNILETGQYNIIIGKQLAKKINANIGDKIKLILLSNKKNFFSGKVFKTCLFKIVGMFSTQNEIDYYQVLINKNDAIKFLNYSKNYITGWRIWFKNPLSLDLNKIKKSTNQLLLFDWKLKKGELFKAMKIEKYVIMFLFFLVFLITVFNIFINLTAYIIEKKNTIAILKTQGLTNWKIMLIFIIIGSSTTIIGNIIGTMTSIFLILQNDFLRFFINIFFKDVTIPIVISPYQIVCINVISICITVLSTLFAVLNAVESEPAKILSNE